MSDFIRMVYGYLSARKVDTTDMEPKEAIDKYRELTANEKSRLTENGNSDKLNQNHNAKVFKSGKEANEYFAEQEKTWIHQLNTEIQQTIYAYSTDAYYDINSYLRGVFSNYKPASMMIEHLDDAIAKFDLKEPIRVYRAVNIQKELQGVVPEIGSIKEWKAFTSTSVDAETVDDPIFALYEIDVPAGKGRGAYINALSEYKDVEYEFLLKRGTRVRITGVRTEKGRKIISMEVF